MRLGILANHQLTLFRRFTGFLVFTLSNEPSPEAFKSTKWLYFHFGNQFYFSIFFKQKAFSICFETITLSRGSVRIQEYSCTTQNKSLGRLELKSSRIAHARELACASSRIAQARELALERSTVHLEPHSSVRVPEQRNVTPVMARRSNDQPPSVRESAEGS